VGEALGVKVATDGASPEVLHALGIPLEWAERCEDAAHVGHDGTSDSLALRLEWVRANQFSNFLEKITQLGSYGGGNHFGECEVVRLPVNHGAGRCMGRKAADRALDQKAVDDDFATSDILTNCRWYPKDEAPAAYKDFDAVLDSVKAAGLASEVARLKARFVIKDSDTSLRGAA
jgi:RNA-splicing ligase RtcB